MKKRKRNPNLSKYDAPLRIQFERGVNAFRGKQYIKSVDGIKIIATENPQNSNTMQHREWQRGYNFAYYKQLEKVKQYEARRGSQKVYGS